MYLPRCQVHLTVVLAQGRTQDKFMNQHVVVDLGQDRTQDQCMNQHVLVDLAQGRTQDRCMNQHFCDSVVLVIFDVCELWLATHTMWLEHADPIKARSS